MPRMWLILPRIGVIDILKVPNFQNNVAQHNTAMLLCSLSKLKSSSIAIGVVPAGVDSAGTIPCYCISTDEKMSS